MQIFPSPQVLQQLILKQLVLAEIFEPEAGFRPDIAARHLIFNFPDSLLQSGNYLFRPGYSIFNFPYLAILIFSLQKNSF
jgi:hypothetical protein